MYIEDILGQRIDCWHNMEGGDVGMQQCYSQMTFIQVPKKQQERRKRKHRTSAADSTLFQESVPAAAVELRTMETMKCKRRQYSIAISGNSAATAAELGPIETRIHGNDNI
ncbi:hypothetical protein DFS33DRAFT_1278508 [Desarmillaria ectypa]|nr:hypothetical protein DFS33DRAFT_1278508 [Desarmillaria ectypa]